MKIKNALTILGVLSLVVGLTSCDTQTSSSATTTTTTTTTISVQQKHTVSVSGSGFTTVGLDSAGYSEGSLVTLAFFAEQGLRISGVTTSLSSVTLTLKENVVTFTMPNSDIELTVTTSSVGTDVNVLDEMLAQLKEGISMGSTIDETQVWTYNDGTTSNTRNARIVDTKAVDGFAKATKYSAVYAQDGNNPNEVLKPNRLTVSYNYSFAKNPEAGQLSQVELAANNKLKYNNVLDSTTNQALKWDETFKNPFSLLTSDMFTIDENDPTVYHMDTSNVLYEPILRMLAHFIYGEPNDYVVEELNLTTKDGEIVSYDGHFKDYDYTGFVYTSKIKFSGEILNKGVDVVEVPKPIEGEEIPALKEKLDSLKDANFTVVTQEISEDWYGNKSNTYYKALSDGGDHIHQLNYIGDIADNVTSDEYLYTQLSEEDSWAPGGIAYDAQIATNIKGTWYSFGSLVDGMVLVDDLLPSFDISTVLFEEGETAGTYVLRSDLPSYFAGLNSSSFSLFTSNEAGELTIDTNNNQIKFDLKASESSYTNDEVTTFSNIGSTSVANTAVTTSTEALTKWEDYFTSQSVVDSVLAILPSRVLNYIPLPKLETYEAEGNNLTSVGVYADSSSNEVQLQIRLDEYGDNADAQYEDLLVLITNGLTENGFELTSLDPWYGYTFNKVETINEKQTDISVSLGASGSYFLVDFALSEVIGE